MKIFERSAWIWSNSCPTDDEYAEFYADFEAKDGALCRLSVDGDYTLFVNGAYVASNQYGDYEHYKIYDEIDLAPYIREGKNSFALLVWHLGFASSRYLPAPAGAIFEVVSGDEIVAHSSADTLSRKSPAYKNGYLKVITGQLGCSYLYDANLEDGWKLGELCGFERSVVVDKKCELFVRPVAKHILLERKLGRVISSCGKTHYLLDFGEETVGLFGFDFSSESAQKVTVSFGEHIADGGVRRKIGGRDFSFEYVANPGENSYTNYMLRLGCRYVEIDCESDIELVSAFLLPQVYPGAVRKPFDFGNETDNKIYDVCVKSLELCMMEHYVDCPWREQCLYSFDSRNQMLFGYYAFENGNREYVRSNLKLMSQDRRADRLLAITYPCGIDLTIPSFSLWYFQSIKEYIENTGDTSLAHEVHDRICDILSVFLNQTRDRGVICKFESAAHWNFYDWSEFSEGTLGHSEAGVPDALINLLTYWALKNYGKICDMAGIAPRFDVEGESEKILSATRERFFNAEKGLFSMVDTAEQYTEVVNSIAVCSGALTGDEAKAVCAHLAANDLVPLSLSMKVFKYGAMIKVDKNFYRERILSEMRQDYTYMLDQGATSFWETIEGEAAFDNAGSLCHGWSAIPVYVLNELK